jgi:hypothetical protein
VCVCVGVCVCARVQDLCFLTATKAVLKAEDTAAHLIAA